RAAAPRPPPTPTRGNSCPRVDSRLPSRERRTGMTQRRTRREFSKAVALLAAAPVALAMTPTASAQEPKPDVSPRAATATALHDILRARYGKHLSEEQLKRLRQRVTNSVAAAEAMQRVPLVNADEPAF